MKKLIPLVFGAISVVHEGCSGFVVLPNSSPRVGRETLISRFGQLPGIETSRTSQLNHTREAKLDKLRTPLRQGEEHHEEKEDEKRMVEIILRDLNPSQRRAVTSPLGGITLVVAGPGAGKTRVLTSRVAWLLTRDAGSSKILAVTFTKRAAKEMESRLEGMLFRGLENTAECECGGREVTGYPLPSGGVDNAREMEQDVVAAATPDLASAFNERVTIGTFHSICARILRWNGNALSSLPSVASTALCGSANVTSTVLDGTFAIVDQAEQIKMLKECLVEAGVNADSLKKGMSRNKQIKPVQILNVISRIKCGELEVDDGQLVGRVEKIARKVLPFYRSTLLSSNCLDFDDLILLTRELLIENVSLREALQRRWPHVLVDEFQDTSRVQLELVRLLTNSSLLVVGDGDQSIYSWRGAHVRSMGDFVDKFGGAEVVETVYLMENYRSTTNIVKAAQKIISAIGTSSLSQNDTGSTADGRKTGEVCVRPDMIPMRGRGPTPRIVACGDSKTEANYIIKTINGMIQAGDLKPDSTIAIIYRTNAQSRILEEACVANNLRYVIRGNVGRFYSRAEIKDCLCFLRCLYNGRDRTSLIRAFKTPRRGIGDKSIAEFFAYCQVVERTFEGADVERRQPATASPTPFDVLISLSEFDASWSDLATMDNEAVGKDKKVPVLPPPTDTISKRAFNSLRPFARQMATLKHHAKTKTVFSLLSSIVTMMKIRGHIDNMSVTNDEFNDRWGNVMELCQAADRYSVDGPSIVLSQGLERSDGTEISKEPNLREVIDGVADADSPLGRFLDDVALLTDMDVEDDIVQSVEPRIVANLMTIHASKGMEFDAVFLVGNEEGTLPMQRAIVEGEGSLLLAEERRLCYVAMTRAKTHLMLTWRKKVTTFFGMGLQTVSADRSRFLDTLVSKKDRKNRFEKEGRKREVAEVDGRENEIGRSYRSTFSKQKKEKKKGPHPRKLFVKGKPKPSRAYSSVPRRGPKGLHAMRSHSDHKIPGNKIRDTPSKGSMQVESTMFFPVGLAVIHGVHGTGRVVSSQDETKFVTVEFENGMVINFPMSGSGLQIRYGQ